MSVPVCDQCENWIEVSNRTFAGFCSPACRNTHRAQRAAARDKRRRHTQEDS